ncbi:MAG: metalloregulator ArsR/SmtB family transcription factor [Clostridiales bacterium]|nr:winged helix-turn-helix transcriptional regulator [Clostridia bacterium]MCR4747768.1 metalloregulator ArsR/SmtB family transcription factor [Clostridiales bacterium]
MENRSAEEFQTLAELFKLFGDGTRIRILTALKDGEKCVRDIADELGMNVSAISHQLKSLKVANMVRSRRDGQNIYYALSDDHVESIINIGLEHIREGKEN